MRVKVSEGFRCFTPERFDFWVGSLFLNIYDTYSIFFANLWIIYIRVLWFFFSFFSFFSFLLKKIVKRECIIIRNHIILYNIVLNYNKIQSDTFKTIYTIIYITLCAIFWNMILNYNKIQSATFKMRKSLYITFLK